MDRDEMQYKGFRILAVPIQLAESKKWPISINIERHTGDKVNCRNFSAGDTYKTREEAVQHCFNFGKQIIDGKVEGCTVQDL